MIMDLHGTDNRYDFSLSMVPDIHNSVIHSCLIHFKTLFVFLTLPLQIKVETGNPYVTGGQRTLFPS